MSKPTAYLVDASIYIFRAWFSVPDSMRGETGQAVNAVYGFTRFLVELLDRTQATHIGITFDESLSQSFRNDLYPAYKMNRELPPEELAQQFKLCRRVAQAAGIYCVSHNRYEADDLVATLAGKMRAEGFRIGIVSGDKDLTQIIRDEDFWWDFARNQQLTTSGVQDKFGVHPDIIQDYLGLCGDAVDNIPGVPGIGPKTAVSLLQALGNMENVYANLDAIADLPIRGAKKLADKLIEHQQQAFLSKQLATVAYDAPIQVNAHALRRQCAEISEFRQLSQILAGRGEGLFQRMIDSARLLSART